jgi:hypothetical protein
MQAGADPRRVSFPTTDLVGNMPKNPALRPQFILFREVALVAAQYGGH